MKDPAIPTPEQIRRMPVTSVVDLRAALCKAGLIVRPGGTHQRIETADGAFVGTLPWTPSDRRALLNTRSWLAQRVGQIRTANKNTNQHQERS